MMRLYNRLVAVVDAEIRDLILMNRVRVYLLGRRAVLSAFEIETIREADARVRARLGTISAAERQVIEDALDAMQAAGLAA